MARPKPRYTPAPRIWNAFQVAARLGMGENHFGKVLPKLLANRFPPHDELLGGWDADAIERWLDRRSGIVEHFPTDLDREMAEWAS